MSSNESDLSAKATAEITQTIPFTSPPRPIDNYAYRLETRYIDANGDGDSDGSNGGFEYTLINLSDKPIKDFTLTLSCIIRLAFDAEVQNADYLSRVANLHTFAPPQDFELGISEQWTFGSNNLQPCPPKHRVDGPSSGYLTFADGNIAPINVGDLHLVGGTDSGERRHVPTGKTDIPLGIQPWPNTVSITAYAEQIRPYSPSTDASTAERQAVAVIAGLAYRLFPDSEHPFLLSETSDVDTINVDFSQQTDLPTAGYQLEFSDDSVELLYGDDAGLSYGLTVLAQIHHASSNHPLTFSMPRIGLITDSPRHGWRGSHLDVSRHFWPKSEISRFLDILAWSRMNIFHWHLIDDEAWRLEIKALPELTQKGAVRGPGCRLKGQHDYSHQPYGGYYSQEDVKELIDHATKLHIDIVPEIDVPGHCHAALEVYPHLRDPDETAESYHSIQGYGNNALNPGVEATYPFLETVFKEVAALFPSKYIHVGADEVDGKAWQQSPKAQSLAAAEGLKTTMELQAYLLRKTQAMLRSLGKELAGWDEVSHGGGVDKNGTLLVAWQTPEVIQALCQQGYEVIASPGQAYYLDQVQATGWKEPGASWAAVCTPEDCYSYEAIEGLSDDEVKLVKGVQACIWCEHISTRGHFNYMVFPRLYAVAEAGWTHSANKDWLRHCAISKTMPLL